MRLASADLRATVSGISRAKAAADAAVEASFHLKEAARLTWRAAQLVDPSRWRLPDLVLLAPKVRGAAERAGALASAAEAAAVAALPAHRTLNADALPFHELRRAIEGPTKQGMVFTPEGREAGVAAATSSGSRGSTRSRPGPP